AARLVARRHRPLPAGGISDADRRRDRFGIWDRVAPYDGRRAGGLVAHHLGQLPCPAGAPVLLESLPVRRDVAGVAYGDEEVVGGFAQLVDDLEGGAF